MEKLCSSNSNPNLIWKSRNFSSCPSLVRSSASTSDPVLSAVTAKLPTCLQTSTVSACVNELPVYALMDKGSSDSYIDASLLLDLIVRYLIVFDCKKLDLIVRGNPSTISMASKSRSVKVNGTVNVDLNVFNNQYLSNWE